MVVNLFISKMWLVSYKSLLFSELWFMVLVLLHANFFTWTMIGCWTVGVVMFFRLFGLDLGFNKRIKFIAFLAFFMINIHILFELIAVICFFFYIFLFFGCGEDAYLFAFCLVIYFLVIIWILFALRQRWKFIMLKFYFFFSHKDLSLDFLTVKADEKVIRDFWELKKKQARERRKK